MSRFLRPGAKLALALPLLALTACANWPGFKSEPARVELALATAPVAFRIEGRVSVKADEESFSGSMQWLRDTAKEELLLRTPLGQGVAEMRRVAAGVELKNAEGRVYFAEDADALVRQALGLELPLRGLAWWVVGLPRPEARYQAIPDAEGHLGELLQDGWRISFSKYMDRNGQMLPGRLIARRGDTLEVRIVIDEWGLP